MIINVFQIIKQNSTNVLCLTFIAVIVFLVQIQWCSRSVQRASFTHRVSSQHKPDATLNIGDIDVLLFRLWDTNSHQSLAKAEAEIKSHKVRQGRRFSIGAGFKFGATDFRIQLSPESLTWDILQTFHCGCVFLQFTQEWWAPYSCWYQVMGSLSWHRCLQISRLSVFFLQRVLTVADHQFDSGPKLDFLVSARRHTVQDGRHRTHNLTAHQQLLLSVQSRLVCLSSLTTSADVSAHPVTLTVLCRNTCSACESVGRCFIPTLPFWWISYYTRAQHPGRELLTCSRTQTSSDMKPRFPPTCRWRYSNGSSNQMTLKFKLSLMRVNC